MLSLNDLIYFNTVDSNATNMTLENDMADMNDTMANSSDTMANMDNVTMVSFICMSYS